MNAAAVDLHYCRTVYETRLWHPGPHEVGLGLRWAGMPEDRGYDGRWLLGRALDLATGYDDDRDIDLAVLRPVLTRPEIKPFHVAVTDEERVALARILAEAEDYWLVCDYADDEDEGDRWLGLLAEQHLVVRYADCLAGPLHEMPEQA